MSKLEVKVQYLFSQNDLIGSKAIVWGTRHEFPELKKEETPSHVAILINEKWVFESTLETGVRVIGYTEWSKKNREVAKIDCTLEHRYYEDIKAMFKALKEKKYDWGGAVYLGFCLGANKACNVEIPKENKWHREHKYFCCEVMAEMTGLDYQMSSPVKVMMDLKAAL